MSIFSKLFRKQKQNTIKPTQKRSAGDIFTFKEVVEDDKLFRLSVAQSCIKYISEDIASLPLKLYVKTEDGRREAEGDPLNKVLQIKANSYTPSITFREYIVASILTKKAAYAEKVFDGVGNVVGLYPLEPNKIEPVIENRRKYFRYKKTEHEIIKFPFEKIFEVQGFSVNGLYGDDPLNTLKNPLEIGKLTEDFVREFYENGSFYGGYFHSPNNLDDTTYDRLKAERNQARMHKTNKDIILEGVEYKALTMSMKDSDFIQTRKHQIAEIARFYRVPLPFLNELDRATFNNIEELGIWYVKYCLLPICRRIEQYMNLCLIKESEQDIKFIKHNLDGLLRGDARTRWETYRVGLDKGVYNIDEVREMEELNRKGLDKHYIQLNMQQIGEEIDINKLEEQQK